MLNKDLNLFMNLFISFNKIKMKWKNIKVHYIKNIIQINGGIKILNEQNIKRAIYYKISFLNY